MLGRRPFQATKNQKHSPPPLFGFRLGGTPPTKTIFQQPLRDKEEPGIRCPEKEASFDGIKSEKQSPPPCFPFQVFVSGDSASLNWLI
jgi:hypothetical protein